MTPRAPPPPNGYSEAAFTWDVSNRLAKILKSRGATVKLTRDGNSGVGPCITQRAAIGNRAKADAAISVHADGSATANHGFHVIMPKKINGPVDPVVGPPGSSASTCGRLQEGTGLPYSTYIGSGPSTTATTSAASTSPRFRRSSSSAAT